MTWSSDGIPFTVRKTIQVTVTDNFIQLLALNKQMGSPIAKCMFLSEYSALLTLMFDTYPASKCTTKNMYTRVCAGLVVIVSLRTALGSLKEERKKTKIGTICVCDDFGFTTLETSISRAKGIFKLRKFA